VSATVICRSPLGVLPQVSIPSSSLALVRSRLSARRLLAPQYIDCSFESSNTTRFTHVPYLVLLTGYEPGTRSRSRCRYTKFSGNLQLLARAPDRRSFSLFSHPAAHTQQLPRRAQAASPRFSLSYRTAHTQRLPTRAQVEEPTDFEQRNRKASIARDNLARPIVAPSLLTHPAAHTQRLPRRAHPD
jgi:hypothetical protein